MEHLVWLSSAATAGRRSHPGISLRSQRGENNSPADRLSLIRNSVHYDSGSDSISYFSSGKRLGFRLGVSTLVLTLAATVGMPGRAQAAPSITKLEAQIQELKQELDELKAAQAAQAAQPAPAVTVVQQQEQAEIDAIVANQTNVSRKSAASPKVGYKGGRFSLSSEDGQNTIALTGRVHIDAGDYLSVRPASKTSPVQNLSSGINARAARLGVTGKLGGVWGYTFIYDFGNSSDATLVEASSGAAGKTTAITNNKGIQSAQLAYLGFKNTAIELGYSDTFFTLDEATSSNDTLFLERALPSDVSTAVAAGNFRSNAGVRHWSPNYWVGAYLTGPTSSQVEAQAAEQFGAYERATYQILSGSDYSLHLGGGVEELFKAPNSGFISPGSAPAVQAANSLTLSDQPELRVDSTALITSGGLGTLANPVTGAQVYNVETAAEYKNLFFQGEYDHIAVGIRGAQQDSFNGGYGEVSYTLTGEAHPYKPDAGAYGGIIPNHPLSLSQGGFGAWELAARLSYVGLNDNLHSKLPGTGAGGGDLSDVTVGLNWYVNSNMRYMLDYVRGIDHGSSFVNAANGLKATPGTNFDAIAFRAQFAF